MILSRNFFVDTTKGIDVINIGHDIRRAVLEAGAERGLATIFFPQAGATATALDSNQSIATLRKSLESLIENGLIHCLLPRSFVIPIEKGSLMTEPWQEVFLIDYEKTGKRREIRIHLQWEIKESKEEKGSHASQAR